MDKLDAWAFRDLDDHARAQGWQVRRPAPLIRVYRNPAFDRRVPSAGCQGADAAVHGHHLGSGRVCP
ncbi:hypothetical protein [Nonomuraea sp. NPDC002799]